MFIFERIFFATASHASLLQTVLLSDVVVDDEAEVEVVVDDDEDEVEVVVGVEVQVSLL